MCMVGAGNRNLWTGVSQSSAGKSVNLDGLALDMIIPLFTKAGIQWHGWHAFRRGLATNVHQLEVSDKTIQKSCGTLM